jgi:hypothetical protein
VELNTPGDRQVSLAELQAMIESSEITEETRVWMDGWDDWTEIQECREQLGL